MKKMLFGVLFGLAAILGQGCATTQITAFKDPDTGARKLKNVLIVVASSDLRDRMAIEKAIVEKLTAQGIQAQPSTTVFPPTRKYTEQEMRESLAAKGFTEVLFLSPTGSGVTVTGAISQTTAFPGPSAMGVTGFVRRLEKTFQVEIMAVENSKTIWMASTQSAVGRGIGDHEMIVESLTENILAQLKKDGLI